MTTIRNRKKEYRTVKGRDILPNPSNWRRHPDYQRAAMEAILAGVGNIDVLKVVELPDGGLMNLDGHLRADIMADADVDVVVLDLDDDEQRLVLATFDPIGAMAQTDLDTFVDLVDGLEPENEAIAAVLEAVANDERRPLPTPGWDPNEDTVEGTALEAIGYNLISVWPSDGDAATRSYPYLLPLPRQPGEQDAAFRRKYSRSSALEMERIVRTYMRLGDYFLETCAGWFTFSATAALWGYSGEGTDIWPTSLEFGTRQLRKLPEGSGKVTVLEADARELPYDDDRFDFVYCNPPFWQLERYSEDARDLSRTQTLPDWLNESGRIMGEMMRVVKPGGLVVTVMADYRKDGVFVPLHSYWIEEALKIGLSLHDLVVHTLRTEQVRIWRKSYERRRTVKAHEYVIVFKAPG